MKTDRDGAPVLPAAPGMARGRSARELARSHTERMVEILAGIAENAEAKDSDRIAAASRVLQLGWGTDGTGENRPLGPQAAVSLHLDALKLHNVQDQHVRVIEAKRAGTIGVPDGG